MHFYLILKDSVLSAHQFSQNGINEAQVLDEINCTTFQSHPISCHNDSIFQCWNHDNNITTNKLKWDEWAGLQRSSSCFFLTLDTHPMPTACWHTYSRQQRRGEEHRSHFFFLIYTTRVLLTKDWHSKDISSLKKKNWKTGQNTCLQLPYTWNKQSELQSDQDSQLWWCMTVIPAHRGRSRKI